MAHRPTAQIHSICLRITYTHRERTVAFVGARHAAHPWSPFSFQFLPPLPRILTWTARLDSTMAAIGSAAISAAAVVALRGFGRRRRLVPCLAAPPRGASGVTASASGKMLPRSALHASASPASTTGAPDADEAAVVSVRPVGAFHRASCRPAFLRSLCRNRWWKRS